MPKRSPAPKSVTKSIGTKKGKVKDTLLFGGKQDAVLSLRALSIRQPWAEQIMRGEKTIEIRSRNTHVRGTVYLYAGLRRYTKALEAGFAKEVGFELDDLARGLIVGTVDIVDCKLNKKHGDYEWILAKPKRLKKLLKPSQQPNPTWFYPYVTPKSQ
ncbi:MAG TPA: ASCH domain-containing protein [Pirellula sp.]|nr:ASCH domain-containing protein [Pirellula sp.]